MNRSIVDATRTHFNLSLEMLEKMISQCPDELWKEKRAGYVFWQQILHALTGADFWMRQSNEQFVEPFTGKKVYPELEQDPEDQLSKENLIKYAGEVQALSLLFFEGKDDAWLNSGSTVYNKITNMDVVFMQIRHILYHVGHCDSILRESGYKAVEWVDYFGD
jgi:uncharacterized damage-inducible protein DinB